jgi:hypothetical protein
MRLVEHTACTEEIRNAYRILLRKHEGRRHSEDPGIDGRTVLKWISRKYAWCEVVGCIHVSQDSDQWQVLVDAVMNLHVPQKAPNF